MREQQSDVDVIACCFVETDLDSSPAGRSVPLLARALTPADRQGFWLRRRGSRRQAVDF
jgi:hypothetical protein